MEIVTPPSTSTTYDFPKIESKEVAIEEFVRFGYALTPLKGKKAYIDRWEQTKNDPNWTADDFPNNYGVVLRNIDLVIDVDPRNFEDPHTFDRFNEEFGPFKDTFIVNSGGQGGFHIYLTKPEDFILGGKYIKKRDENTGKTINAYPGIEIASKGAQVVGPYSIHPESRRQYLPRHGNPGARMMCSEKLLGSLTQANTNFDEIQTGLKDYDDGEAVQRRYVVYLVNREPAIQGRGGDIWTLQAAYYGRDLGLSPQTTYALMAEHYNDRCDPPWPLDELKAKVINAYKYARGTMGASNPKAVFGEYLNDTSDATSVEEMAKKYKIKWDLTKEGTLKPKSSHNIKYFLLLPGTSDAPNPVYQGIRLNTFTNNIEFTIRPPWIREDENRSVVERIDAHKVHQWLYEQHNYESGGEANVYTEIRGIAYDNRFNPIANYLNSLEWDGVARIDNMLHHYCGAKLDEYTKAVGRKTLIAMVARALDPGCQFDHVLILEGKQGIRKSSFVRILGGDYYGALHTFAPEKTDTARMLSSNWVIELPEMEFLSKRKVDMNVVKAFLTKTVDEYRPLYEEAMKKVKRHSIFIGTINPEGDGAYLRDATGNRRFWPVAVNMIDTDALKADRDQLLAEALVAYKSHEQPYMDTEKLRNLAIKEQSQRMSGDPWTEIISGWIESNGRSGTPILKTTAMDVLRNVLGVSSQNVNQMMIRRVSNILVYDIGFEKRKIRFGKAVTNGFMLVDNCEDL